MKLIIVGMAAKEKVSHNVPQSHKIPHDVICRWSACNSFFKCRSRDRQTIDSVCINQTASLLPDPDNVMGALLGGVE
jgi:hypothetical protein